MKATLEPFPHIVAGGLWSDDLLDGVIAEFPDGDDERWRRYSGDNEDKLEGSSPDMWGDATRELLTFMHAPEWCEALAGVFDIPDLTADTVGGGYHSIPTGGRLAVHVDFNRHPNNGLYRRLNCLVYLNRGYRPEYGGQLILGNVAPGDPGATDLMVEPSFNTTAIFATSDVSWHGHPTPWAGPEPRRSVAVYYYSPEPPPNVEGDHSTVWASNA